MSFHENHYAGQDYLKILNVSHPSLVARQHAQILLAKSRQFPGQSFDDVPKLFERNSRAVNCAQVRSVNHAPAPNYISERHVRCLKSNTGEVLPHSMMVQLAFD
jgi:hypothetical protein